MLPRRRIRSEQEGREPTTAPGIWKADLAICGGVRILVGGVKVQEGAVRLSAQELGLFALVLRYYTGKS